MGSANGASTNGHTSDGAFPQLHPRPAVRLLHVPLQDLRAHPDNPRKNVDQDVEDLGESIRDFGLQQPISVQPEPGGGFVILGGHRRWQAYKRNLMAYPGERDRWSEIPAVVGQPIPAEDAIRGTLTLIAQQLHTQAWTHREEAAAFDRLHSQGKSIRDISLALHRSAGLVSKRRRVYDDDVLSGAVQSGAIPTGVAEELLVVTASAVKRELTQRAIKEHWTQIQARAAVRDLEPVRRAKHAVKLVEELTAILDELHPDDFNQKAQTKLWALQDEIRRLARKQVRGAKPERIMPTMVQVEGPTRGRARRLQIPGGR